MFIRKTSLAGEVFPFAPHHLNQINVYLLMYDIFNYSQLENETIYQEHKELVQLIEQKDEKGLLELLNQHLDSSLQDLKIDKMQYQPLESLF